MSKIYTTLLILICFLHLPRVAEEANPQPVDNKLPEAPPSLNLDVIPVHPAGSFGL